MYLIQDVQILMNSWMIHVLKLENLNQIVNNISHSHRVRYYSALWYGYKVFWERCFPITWSTSRDSNDRKENVRDIISNFTKTYCTPVKITSISLIQYLPDGCSEYMVIAVTRDSTYTYSAVLDPEKTEVINFILEESIPRLENYQNK